MWIGSVVTTASSSLPWSKNFERQSKATSAAGDFDEIDICDDFPDGIVTLTKLQMSIRGGEGRSGDLKQVEFQNTTIDMSGCANLVSQLTHVRCGRRNRS